VPQPLERIPLFVRQDALIPLADLRDTVGDGPFAELTLCSWGGGSSETTICDTDGDTRVSARRTGDLLAVEVDGPARVTRIEFAAVADVDLPGTVTVNGATAALGTRNGLLTATGW